MKKAKGFTLVEMVIVIVIVSAVIIISLAGAVRLKMSLEYRCSVKQVVADIKLTQQLADTSLQLCRIDFRPGKNAYTITKGGNMFKSASAGKNIQFYGKSYFSFVQSGYTDLGGSGTLFLGGSPKVKKIIVSSRGRIRVE